VAGAASAICGARGCSLRTTAGNGGGVERAYRRPAADSFAAPAVIISYNSSNDPGYAVVKLRGALRRCAVYKVRIA
jgi:hypothetical protein